jgi:hypothetical protein
MKASVRRRSPKDTPKIRKISVPRSLLLMAQIKREDPSENGEVCSVGG